jgi:hypothetical protein
MYDTVQQRMGTCMYRDHMHEKVHASQQVEITLAHTCRCRCFYNYYCYNTCRRRSLLGAMRWSRCGRGQQQMWRGGQRTPLTTTLSSTQQVHRPQARQQQAAAAQQQQAWAAFRCQSRHPSLQGRSQWACRPYLQHLHCLQGPAAPPPPQQQQMVCCRRPLDRPLVCCHPLQAHHQGWPEGCCRRPPSHPPQQQQQAPGCRHLQARPPACCRPPWGRPQDIPWATQVRCLSTCLAAFALVCVRGTWKLLHSTVEYSYACCAVMHRCACHVSLGRGDRTWRGCLTPPAVLWLLLWSCRHSPPSPGAPSRSSSRPCQHLQRRAHPQCSSRQRRPQGSHHHCREQHSGKAPSGSQGQGPH